MPKESYSVPLESVLKADSRVSFEYYNKNSKSFSSTPSKICHVTITDSGTTQMDILLVIFTIIARNEDGVKSNIKYPAVASEGSSGGPTTMVPIRDAAIRLAAKNNWKCIPIAIGGSVFDTNIVSKYIISIESLAFGDEAIMRLDDIFKLDLNNPCFCRTTIKTKKSNYNVSFIPKNKFIDYLLMFDNRQSDEIYQKAKANIKIFDGFQPWLTSDDNPDYTGTEKYENYAYSLKRIISKMKDSNLIEDDDLNDLSVDKYERYIDLYSTNADIKEYVEAKNSAGAGLAALKKYILYIRYLQKNKIVLSTGLSAKFEWNRILFGAPGTGKSYQLEQDKNIFVNNGGEYERTTFHPEYSYAQFVGTYKPQMDENDEIKYEYTPGPFIRSLVKAYKSGLSDNPHSVLLIIEEINRANMAAVFGDVFQLLDRNCGVSQYPIQISEDLKKYLSGELGFAVDTIQLPDNFYIWATMNSADQGVAPMDTAFKRRWNFEYIGIDDGESTISAYEYEIAGKKINWNNFRKAINDWMATENINEDKQLGPFFISKNFLDEISTYSDADKNKAFIKMFKDKVLMYLFEDACKSKRERLFDTISTDKNYKKRYSAVCNYFEKKGLEVFNPDIQSKYSVLSMGKTI